MDVISNFFPKGATLNRTNLMDVQVCSLDCLFNSIVVLNILHLSFQEILSCTITPPVRQVALCVDMEQRYMWPELVVVKEWPRGRTGKAGLPTIEDF